MKVFHEAEYIPVVLSSESSCGSQCALMQPVKVAACSSLLHCAQFVLPHCVDFGTSESTLHLAGILVPEVQCGAVE